MSEPEIDDGLIDEAVLALMFLTLHDADQEWGTARAWKGYDWETLGRLYAQDLIQNPVGKAKSVLLTKEGRRKSEEAFYRLFTKRT